VLAVSLSTYQHHRTTPRLTAQDSVNFGYDPSGDMTSAGTSTFGYTPDQQL
jgi:hypothetical protein